jgi:hypothetical protein
LCVKVWRINESRNHKEYETNKLISFKDFTVSIRDYKQTIQAECNLNEDNQKSENAFNVAIEYPQVNLN